MRAFPLASVVRTATVLPGPDRHGVQLSPLTDEQHCHSTGLECAVLNSSERDGASPTARLPPAARRVCAWLCVGKPRQLGPGCAEKWGTTNG